MTDAYSIGDDVVVTMPDGEHRGTVTKVMFRYSFHEAEQYEVTGKDFVTTCKSGDMRMNGKLF